MAKYYIQSQNLYIYGPLSHLKIFPNKFTSSIKKKITKGHNLKTLMDTCLQFENISDNHLLSNILLQITLSSVIKTSQIQQTLNILH